MLERPYEKLDCQSLVDVDLPDGGPITAETRRRAVEYAQRHCGGSAEYEKYREAVLSRELP